MPSTSLCRSGGLLAALLGLLAGCGRPPAAPVRQRPPVRSETVVERRLGLAAGAATEAAIRGGEVHVYRFDLAAGQLADLAVDQRGIDVALTLAGPGGRIAGVDGPYGDQGPEPAPLVAERAGSYRLEVRPTEARAAPGRYAVLVRALRPARPEDRTRVEAERAWDRGEELRGTGRPEGIAAAVAAHQKALALFTRLGDDARRVDALASLGWDQEAREDEAAARDAFAAALPLLRAQGRERERGKVLNGLGKALRLLADPRALPVLEEALAASRHAGDPREEAIAWNALGKAHEVLGEAEAALAAEEKAVALFHQLAMPMEEGTTLANLGSLHASLGQLVKAKDDLGRALPLLYLAGRSREAARALADYWVVRSRMDQSPEGFPALAHALAVQRAIGDRRGEATTRNDLGWLHFWRGDRRRAQGEYLAAAAAFRALGDGRGEARAETNLAWLDVGLGRPAAAVSHAERALPALAAAGDRDGEAQALLALARARRALGDLTAAQGAIAQALARIEALRREPASHQARADFLAGRQEFYGFEVALLMDLDARNPGAGYAEEAFAASEEGRARSLLDMLAEAGADLKRGVPGELLDREAELGRRVNAADSERRRLAAAGAPQGRVAAAEREVAALLDQYDRAQARLRLASPRYGALALPRPASIREAARLFDRDSLLLEYALGEERSFLWVVSPQGLEATFALPGRAAIEGAARRAAGLLAESRRALARRETEIALAELSRLLVAPAAPRLAGRRLVVVADGPLHYIPFGALPDPADPAGAPLLAGHEVVNLPSASALAAQRRELAGRKPAPGAVAVVADPVFSAADPRIAIRPATARPAASPAFDRLPAAREEAEAILALAPPAGRFGALGFDANRETVLSGELSRYRNVHFATHAVLDASHPELSGIVLSQVDSQGQPREGFLRAHEIYRLRLPAELVVLSACQTALGRELRGEGLVGLTRGFQYAGARQVLVSLWPVEDRATAELMARFYRGLLRERLSPAAALRAAQLGVLHLKGWESPYYWAGFVLQGDWHPE